MSSTVTTKLVYDFSEGSRDMRELLGGKGANVAEMTRLGLPVPPGFTITTEACIAFLRGGREFPPGLREEIDEHLARLEEDAGKRLGDPDDPLLVSVRSGAKFSMPGMMDTILNLGMNDRSVEGLAGLTGNPRFAYDSYRRFIQMYGDVVSGVEKRHFEAALGALKGEVGAAQDVDLTAEDLKRLVGTYKAIYQEHYGSPFPQEARAQLDGAVRAVFESWENRRAYDYRRLHNIGHDLGTAVNVQRMVFGNTGDRSATGVAFTRNNVTGEKGEPFGDFLVNAQGEDVVAGIRTPHPLHDLKGVLPEAFDQLMQTMDMLERTYKNMQDVEFTIEDGRLYMLQTRNGKRSALAMARVAVDLVDEGLVDERESLRTLVDAGQVRQLLLPQLDANSAADPLAVGVNASPGAAVGEVVFTADEAERRGREGHRVILVRDETTPDDLHGMIGAQGILTARGGKTSHAAIVAVGMGKPAVCGVSEIEFAEDGSGMRIAGVAVREGEVITIDGTSGKVFAGEAPLLPPQADSPELLRILEWADRVRTLKVRTNADTPEDATRAREFGAEGIGLCRTEHMFFAEDRIPIMQQAIMRESAEERAGLVEQLRGFQEDDFAGIFRAMRGLPVTIRLLDPPLHEFLPKLVELEVEVAQAKQAGTPDAEKEALLARVHQLHELNPMLGTRGVRLGMEMPEVYRMQAGAIMTAALRVRAETGEAPLVEIMIPLVAFEEELRIMRELVVEECERVLAEAGGERIDYLVGTMIELPRAAITADEIARQADFFSFGTNDLTQTTLGFSRDDAEGKFLTHYLQRNIIPTNPFDTLDRGGVGELIRIAKEKARAVKPHIKLGICGEHGGDPDSVTFCHEIGLDYVSCSPFRVQVARIAAAQAALEEAPVSMA
ncbi:MAG: pyruvate, phosphate dikinase [Thermoleophilia bacterium]|jgi:pyruvate,orthophosphate dikinase|nr:pyruvate, phosphate dikinase [Thermoleophilia bacterium]